MKASTRLRNLLRTQKLIIAPGAFDGLSARLVEQAGFEAIYASGGAIARAAGYPDLGLLSFTEITERLATLVDVTSVPIIADADTGFGGTIQVQRTVRWYEKLGIAALHIEDQEFPKRCGHLDNKSLISTEEMARKVRAAKAAQQDPDFIVIARTDAIAVEGLTAALERAAAYREAGADMLFIEAPESEGQIEAIAAYFPDTPKLINMFHGGKTPVVATARLESLGYQVVIIPSDLQRAAIYAMQQTLVAIQKTGNSEAVSQQLTSFKERERIIDTAAYLAVDVQ
ncbi:MAG: isocitrate lyase [Gammaproteobacteria bacterium RIFCSPHIGHO2_12_FULL_45_9]|nr:MAG: isocitrate lyase [Gammaproteobacteria bacterium RIFCSPHIGHO2_12_FULL_45_9]